jgi:hypothetical protein
MENGDDDDLLGSEHNFDAVCNVVYVLPREYDLWSFSDREEEFVEPPLAEFKPVCYYVMENGCIEEQCATFEKPDEGMKNHLKPLFVRAKVNDVCIKKS